MARTVFITGCSSGIGKGTAKYFQEKGWNVAATMRSIKDDRDLHRLSRVIISPLDVAKPDTVKTAVDKAVRKFGTIDILVNNAGIGIEGPLESFSTKEMREVFETNFFGTLNVTRAVLPVMKKQKSGIIINISSMGGRFAFPYYTTYHASKWAIEGFSESLQYELAPLGIAVKVIEPGIINTDFFRKMQEKSNKPHDGIYRAALAKLFVKKQNARQMAGSADSVAKTIFRAATDGSKRLRYIVGFDAYILTLLKKLFPEQWLFQFVKRFS